MEEYVTLAGEGNSVLTEKKSRFLGNAKHVTTEKEALDFIASVKKSYGDARHIVYAYLLRENNIMRFTDDGEPQGTAGLPVLDIIRKNRFCDAVITVTRYFGGILLGTGGLTRAYSACAKEAVDDARIVTMVRFDEVTFSLDYTLYQKLDGMMKRFSSKLDDVCYGERVNVRAAVLRSDSEAFRNALSELCSGKSDIAFVGERFDFT